MCDEIAFRSVSKRWMSHFKYVQGKYCWYIIKLYRYCFTIYFSTSKWIDWTTIWSSGIFLVTLIRKHTCSFLIFLFRRLYIAFEFCMILNNEIHRTFYMNILPAWRCKYFTYLPVSSSKILPFCRSLNVLNHLLAMMDLPVLFDTIAPCDCTFNVIFPHDYGAPSIHSMCESML